MGLAHTQSDCRSSTRIGRCRVAADPGYRRTREHPDLGNEIELGVAGVAGGQDWYQAPNAIDPAIGKMTFEALMQMPESKRIACLAEHIWPHEARILAALASGICSVDSKSRFSTHVSGMATTQPTFTVAFFKAMKDGGFPVDEVGVSIARPRLHLRKIACKPSKTWLKRFSASSAARFSSPSLVQARGCKGYSSGTTRFPAIQQTPDGQATFARDLVTWGRRQKVLSGIRPWMPDLPLATWAPMSLFKGGGKVVRLRPALDVFNAVAAK